VLKVVLDTNIYISAFIFGGVSKDIIRQAENERFIVYVAPPIVREIRRILQVKFKLTSEEIKLPMKKLKAIGRVVAPRFRLQVLSDRADNRILECAAEAQANVIVTGDLALQKQIEYERIKILSPKQFLSDHNFKI
jgi:putative PIN family toxin of toxin-antitoxin system